MSIYIFPDNLHYPVLDLGPKNYPQFSDAGMPFDGEGVKTSKTFYDSMPKKNQVISLKDLIHSFLLEFSPDAVNHLDDLARRAEDIYSEDIPKMNKRSTSMNTIQRRRIKNNWNLSPLSYLLASKTLRIN